MLRAGEILLKSFNIARLSTFGCFLCPFRNCHWVSPGQGAVEEVIKFGSCCLRSEMVYFHRKTKSHEILCSLAIHPLVHISSGIIMHCCYLMWTSPVCVCVVLFVIGLFCFYFRISFVCFFICHPYTFVMQIINNGLSLFWLWNLIATGYTLNNSSWRVTQVTKKISSPLFFYD